MFYLMLIDWLEISNLFDYHKCQLHPNLRIALEYFLAVNCAVTKYDYWIQLDIG
jgi:hypothetical protein